MKKKLVMVLLACTALTVTGCGTADNKQTEKPTEAATEAKTTETAAEEETEEATEEELIVDGSAETEETTEAATEEETTEAETETEEVTEEATEAETTEEETTEAETEEVTEKATEAETTEAETTEAATEEETTEAETETEEVTEKATEAETTEAETTEVATEEETTEAETETEEATEEATETETETEEETEFDVSELPEYTASDYVTLGEYKGLTVVETPVEITDEEVMAEVEASIPLKELTEGEIAEGDTANIDYEGTLDGVAFDGGTAQGTDLEIGSGTFIEGFESGLIGVAVGEAVDLNLTFPENYHSEDLAGKDVVFHVTVNSIQRPQELTDELAAEISEYKTAEEYKQSVREEMEAYEKEQKRSEAEYSLIQQVYENAEVDGYPEEALAYTLNRARNYYEQYAGYYGMTLEDLMSAYGMDEESFMTELESVAKQTLSQEMVLLAVAEKENLEVTDAEFAEGVEKYAEKSGTDADTLLADYGENYIRNSLTQEKALEFLYDNAKIVVEEETEALTEEETDAETEADAGESEMDEESESETEKSSEKTTEKEAASEKSSETEKESETEAKS